MRRRLGVIGALAAVYLATLGSLALLDIVVGLACGIAIAPLFGRWATRPKRSGGRRLLAWPRSVGVVVRELLRGGVQMFRVLLGLDSWRHRGLVEVELPEGSDTAVAVTAWVVTASPGSLVVDVDEENRGVLLHAIDARNPEAVRGQVLDVHHRAVRPVRE